MNKEEALEEVDFRLKSVLADGFEIEDVRFNSASIGDLFIRISLKKANQITERSSG